MKTKHSHLNFIHLAAAAVPLLLIGIICALAGRLDTGTQKEQELALSNALEHAVTTVMHWRAFIRRICSI